MSLSLSERIDIFSSVGQKIRKVVEADMPEGLSAAEKALHDSIEAASFQNPWFIQENVRHALKGISIMLEKETLRKWLSTYAEETLNRADPLLIAVIMAGNIPFVSFHDMLCVLLSGNRFMGKLSSQDKILPLCIAGLINETSSELASMISFHEGIIKGFDAVIATGSNNSARYFDYYFGKYPHIIRRNRNSLAIIHGDETTEELKGISFDVFMYFGLGCRNVSKILVPEGYDLTLLLDHFAEWQHFLKDHYKFFNNYEYRKAVMLVDKTPHYDTGFSLLTESPSVASPIAVTHYTFYTNEKMILQEIDIQGDALQCIVSSKPLHRGRISITAPGKTQIPGPEEYADGVDTLEFLASL